jgi:hypothetical protein
MNSYWRMLWWRTDDGKGWSNYFHLRDFGVAFFIYSKGEVVGFRAVRRVVTCAAG